MFGAAQGLGEMEDFGQFFQQYGNIMRSYDRIATAKQALGNQFLNTCGPIARVCPPVQRLHQWYMRYFDDWIRAARSLHGALQQHNLGMAIQVQGMMQRAETTQREAQREEDRLRDRYNVPLSPLGPR